MHDDPKDDWQDIGDLPAADALHQDHGLAQTQLIGSGAFPLGDADLAGTPSDPPDSVAADPAPLWGDAADAASGDPSAATRDHDRDREPSFAGYAGCAKCPCQGFVGLGNQCDNCGHRYSDHW